MKASTNHKPHHRLGTALLVSACAHAVWLAVVLNKRDEHGGAPISQRKGALMVVNLVRLKKPPSPPELRPPPKIRQTVAVAAIAAKPIISAAAEPDNTAVPPAQASPAPVVPMPAPVDARPGARFASLFAPILSQPMGHGRWGARPRPVMPPPDPEQMRQQAMAALASDLMQRLDAFRAVRMSQGQTLRCDVRVQADSREALLACDSAEDDALLWGVLRGLLRQATNDTPDVAASLCIQVNATQTLMQTCQNSSTNGTAP